MNEPVSPSPSIEHDDADSSPTPDPAITPLETVESIQQRMNDRDAEIESLRRRLDVTDALAAEPVVDLNAARILVEHAMQHDEVPSAAEAVRLLRRDKPFLFRPTPGVRAHGAVAASPTPAPPVERAAAQLDAAATDARTSGRSTDLMRYLRLRRSV